MLTFWSSCFQNVRWRGLCAVNALFCSFTVVMFKSATLHYMRTLLVREHLKSHKSPSKSMFKIHCLRRFTQHFTDSSCVCRVHRVTERGTQAVPRICASNMKSSIISIIIIPLQQSVISAYPNGKRAWSYVCMYCNQAAILLMCNI
jgi:hypothetical protein